MHSRAQHTLPLRPRVSASVRSFCRFNGNEKVNKYRWWAAGHPPKLYACTRMDGKTVYMLRLLAGARKG